MQRISLESLNYPGLFIRHRNYLGEISEILSDLDRHDATFDMEEFGGMVRLRSVNYPTHVLRHQGGRIKLHEYVGPGLIPPGGSPHETAEEELLRLDSSFVRVPGRADPSLWSFQSVNYRDRFIRHRNGQLWVEPLDSDLALKDATFRRTDPLAPPLPGPH
jgi:hypothetical protein